MQKYANLDSQKICEMYKNGQSVLKIGKILNISNSPIRRILKENKIVSRTVGHPKIYSCNENIFKEESEKSFYLAGFIAADATLIEQKYSKYLKISLSVKDFNHLEKIKLLLESNSIIRHYKSKAKNNIIYGNNVKNSEYDYCQFKITSKTIFDDLKKFNIVKNKTENYELPQWLCDHKLFKHFIRGYIDGDGSICATKVKKCKNLQTSISLIGNYKVLDKINNNFIKECDVNGSKIIHKPNTKHTHRIRFCGNLQVQKIGHYLYDNSTIFLERKFDKIKWLIPR